MKQSLAFVLLFLWLHSGTRNLEAHPALQDTQDREQVIDTIRSPTADQPESSEQPDTTDKPVHDTSRATVSQEDTLPAQTSPVEAFTGAMPAKSPNQDTVERVKKYAYQLRIRHLASRGKLVSPAPDTAKVVYHIQPIVSRQAEGWIFYVLLGLLGLLAYIWFVFRGQVIMMWRAGFNIRIAEQLFRQEESSLPTYAALLTLLFYLSGGLYLYLLINYFEYDMGMQGVYAYMGCVGFLAIIYTLKYIALESLANILPVARIIRMYSFTISILNRVIGMLLLPFGCFMAYTYTNLIPYVVIFSLIVMGGLFAIRYFRGFIIGRDYLMFHKFYFILYLCTLEITPLVIIIKLLSH